MAECFVLLMITFCAVMQLCSSCKCLHQTVVIISLLYSSAPRGVSIAQSMSSKQLKKECATILEGLKVRSQDTKVHLSYMYV